MVNLTAPSIIQLDFSLSFLYMWIKLCSVIMNIPHLTSCHPFCSNQVLHRSHTAQGAHRYEKAWSACEHLHRCHFSVCQSSCCHTVAAEPHRSEQWLPTKNRRRHIVDLWEPLRIEIPLRHSMERILMPWSSTFGISPCGGGRRTCPSWSMRWKSFANWAEPLVLQLMSCQWSSCRVREA